KSRRLPVAERRMSDQPLAAFASPVISVEAQVSSIKTSLLGSSLFCISRQVGGLDVRAFLLACDFNIPFKVSGWRTSPEDAIPYFQRTHRWQASSWSIEICLGLQHPLRIFPQAYLPRGRQRRIYSAKTPVILLGPIIPWRPPIRNLAPSGGTFGGP